MLAVFLTILKIIGITVLCIIAFVLLVVALVLFVPVRYKVSADRSKDADDFTADVNVSFLLHILSATVRYDKELYTSVRVFGIKLKIGNKANKEEKTENVEEPPANNETDVARPEDYTIDWNEEDTTVNDDTTIKDDDFSDNDTKDDGLFEKIESIIESIVSKFESLSEKYDRIKKDLRFWDRMINDSKNQNAVNVIKKQLIVLLRLIRPRRVKGFIHFGFEDPATCGKVLMYLSMIYPVLPRKLVFDPSFNDTDIYGNIVIKGRIFLIVIALCLIKLYFNKDVKRMIRLYKKHKNK